MEYSRRWILTAFIIIVYTQDKILRYLYRPPELYFIPSGLLYSFHIKYTYIQWYLKVYIMKEDIHKWMTRSSCTARLYAHIILFISVIGTSISWLKSVCSFALSRSINGLSSKLAAMYKAAHATLRGSYLKHISVRKLGDSIFKKGTLFKKTRRSYTCH